MSDPAQKAMHIACLRCRERKVKCDGAKPRCRRCVKNRATCHYVQGRRQHGKSEWVQHMRTFRSCPGKAQVTRTPPEVRISQPQSPSPLLQASNTSTHTGRAQSMPHYTRSPSPSFTEDTDMVLDSNITMGADGSGSSFSSCGSIDVGGPLSTPTSMEKEGMFSAPFLPFDSSSLNCTQYTPGFVNMITYPTSFPSHRAFLQPLASVSQPLQAPANLFDEQLHSYVPYSDSPEYPAPACCIVDWEQGRFTTVHEGQPMYRTSPG